MTGAERLKEQIGPKYRPITSEYLDFDEVMSRYEEYPEKICIQNS